MHKPSCSLIIATYNWPAALDICLKSVLKQEQLPDEVIIADDGSKEETVDLIKKYQKDFPVPLIHVWQPDEGFQLAKIRNRSAAASNCDYIIQADGDLIFHAGFVKDHVNAAKEGYFICGSRVILNQDVTNDILQSGSTTVSLFNRGIKNHLNRLRFPSLGRWLAKNIKVANAESIRGCNIAYWKKDFIAVNGYDESYTGWGREDTDLVIRFFNAGCKRKFFKFQGIVYHLWHREADRDKLAANEEILQQAIAQKKVRSEKGIDQYL